MAGQFSHAEYYVPGPDEIFSARRIADAIFLGESARRDSSRSVRAASAAREFRLVRGSNSGRTSPETAFSRAPNVAVTTPSPEIRFSY